MILAVLRAFGQVPGPHCAGKGMFAGVLGSRSDRNRWRGGVGAGQPPTGVEHGAWCPRPGNLGHRSPLLPICSSYLHGNESRSYRRYWLLFGVVVGSIMWWLGPLLGIFLLDPYIQLLLDESQVLGGSHAGVCPAACMSVEGGWEHVRPTQKPAILQRTLGRGGRAAVHGGRRLGRPPHPATRSPPHANR